MKPMQNITVIRESISKIVTLLSNRSIKVTQRGTRAYVAYHPKTGAIESVNIPYIPDDSSEEFVAAVQGFLDHEVAHVLYTDQRIIPVLAKESSRVQNLANAIEDVYIERKMTQAFQGSAKNLDAVRNFYLQRIAKPKIDEALKNGDKATAAGFAAMIQFRAWGGQHQAQEYLENNPECRELVAPMAAKLGADLIAQVAKVSDSFAVLELAKKMIEALKEPEPEGPEQSDEKGGDPSESSPGEKGESNPDESPDKEEGESEEQDDTEGDDTEDDSAGDDDEGDTEDGTEGDDEGEGKDKGDKEEGETDSEKEEGDGDTEDTGDASDASDGGDGETEDSEPEESGEPTDDGEVEAEADDSGKERSETSEADTKPVESDALRRPLDEATEDMLDKLRSFDEDMAEELSEAAAEAAEESTYSIFSKDWDRIEPAREAVYPNSIETMIETTRPMIASMQKKLERAIAAKDKKVWNPGQRRGRINPGALFRTSTGDDRVFRQRYETKAVNTAVTLLIDCSGSMRYSDRISKAGNAAYALASTLDRLKVPFEVLGFTTKQSTDMYNAMKKDVADRGRARVRYVRYARNEPLYIPVFKSFAERMSVSVKSRIAHLTERAAHYWLSENVDGESVQIAAARLKQQRADRHLLLVLSDGSPACPGDHAAQTRHLRQVIADAEKANIEVVGIGIQTRSVKTFYKRHVILDDLSQLPTTVIEELAKVLLAK